MAPTELLAEQHLATLTRLLEPLALKPDLLVGGSRPRRKRRRGSASRRRVAPRGGDAPLIQEAVTFQRLGLAVIDEQHRFGVEQRAALVEKATRPDVLLLTATPIPRSLALTLYGDLDVTQCASAPRPRPGEDGAPHRGSPPEDLRIHPRECVAGRQAYVIYPGDRGIRACRLKARP